MASNFFPTRRANPPPPLAPRLAVVPAAAPPDPNQTDTTISGNPILSVRDIVSYAMTPDTVRTADGNPIVALRFVDNTGLPVTAAGGAGGAFYGDAPPAFPLPGMLWWNSTLGQLFVWYNDGNSSQWVPASPSSGSSTANLDVGSFPGADLGEKLNNAMASLPAATGGVCDARSIVGNQTAAATISVAAHVTVLFGDCTLSCSGNPAIAFASFSTLIGTGKGRTTIQSGVANGDIISPVSDAVRTFAFQMEGITVKQTNNTGMLGLNFRNHSQGRVVNCQFLGLANTGTGVGVYMDGVGGGCYYNQFYQCDTFTLGLGVDLDTTANSNMFIGWRSVANAVGIRFGHSGIVDQNVFYDPMIEGSTIDNIVFDAFSFGNTVHDARIESAGVPYCTNVAGALGSIFRDGYLTSGTAAVDPGGTLTFTGDRGTNIETRPTVFATPTQTTAVSALSITGGWNNAAVIFNGVQININESAADANSNLFNVLRSNSTQFRVSRAGNAIMIGSVIAAASQAPATGGSTGLGLRFSSTLNFGVFFGTGAPNKQAAKGSLYLRTDGTTTNDRMYVNTDGATAWTAVLTVA